MTVDNIATWTFMLAVSGGIIYIGKWMGAVSQSLVGLDRGLSELKDVVSKLTVVVDNRFNQMDAKFDDRFNKMDAKFDDRFNKMDDKVDARFNKLEGDVSALKASADVRLSNLERQTWPHHSTSGLVQSLPEATEPPSATVTPKRKPTKPPEETKIPPRTRTP